MQKLWACRSWLEFEHGRSRAYQKFGIKWVRCNFGGRHPVFICQCGKRAAKTGFSLVQAIGRRGVPSSTPTHSATPRYSQGRRRSSAVRAFWIVAMLQEPLSGEPIAQRLA
jgi:hypothetical protein